MKTSTKITLAAVTAIGIGLAATVQAFGPGYGYGPGYGPGCPNAAAGYGRGMGPGMGMGRFNQDPGARVEWRLAQVEPLLNLTEAQRPAWDQFKEALKTKSAERQTHRQQMQALRAQTSLSERTDQRVALMSQHLESMKAFAEEVKKIDAVLTDEQRATLAQYIGLGPRGGAGRGKGLAGGRGVGPGAGYGQGAGYGPGAGYGQGVRPCQVGW